MMRSLLPILILFVAHIVNGLEAYGTAVAIKRNPLNHTHPIATGTSSYMDLVKKSKMFVDTSLILYSVNMWRNITVLLAPRKWGKTTTLDMIKTFFGMPLNENGDELPIESTDGYRLFRFDCIAHGDVNETLQDPLLISEHKRVVEFYQGQLPVILMSFKHLIVTDPILFERSIMTVIGEVVKQHRFVLGMLPKSSEDYASVKNVLDGSLTYLHYCNSLKIVCDTIFKRYDKRVIVLIDDYDAPLLNLIQAGNYTADQMNYILLVLDNLIGYAFRNNRKHVRVAILSVQFAVSTSQLEGPTWDYNPIDSVMTKRLESQYFGFAQKDIQQLLEASGNTQLSDNLYKWYGGYVGETGVNYASPYSIAKLLKTKKFQPRWSDREDRIVVDRFLDHHSDTILSLISQQTIQVIPYTRIDAGDVMQIRDGLSPTHFHFYLFRIGYLTLDESSNKTHKVARIPNKEITAVMCNWTISYYQRRYRIDDKLLNDAAVAFRDFIRSSSGVVTKLGKTIEALYRSCSKTITPDPATVNKTSNVKQSAEYEELFFNIAYCLTLKMQISSSLEFQVFYDNTREADIVIYDEVSGYTVIANLEYDATSPLNALNRSVECQPGYKIDKVKFIGISISLDEEVRGAVKLKGIQKNSGTV